MIGSYEGQGSSLAQIYLMNWKAIGRCRANKAGL